MRLIIIVVIYCGMVRSTAAVQRGHPESKTEKRRRLRSLGLLVGLIYACGLLVTLEVGSSSRWTTNVPSGHHRRSAVAVWLR